jgi:hypothetical protein
MRTRLNLLLRLFGSRQEIGTCPICHGLVDSRAEAAHLWWHENGQPANGQPKVGKHRVF